MGSPEGFDVVVVTVSTDASRRWWTERLGPGVVVVVEDRPAGTLGGTLRALQKAGDTLGVDLLAPSSRSVAVVHAAGAGTRLEPLTSIEGEKPRVRLPGTVTIGGREHAITLLEAVLRGMAPWAPASAGRITVWWGDQLIAPERPTWSDAPVALLVHEVPPDEASWQAHDLHRYGTVALDGPVAHVEKADRAAFVEALGREPARVGRSLGVFAADPALLSALAEVCAPEAHGRLDVERHAWMPLTLGPLAYARTGGDPAWHARLAPIRARFGPVLGATDPGGWWWDFGTLETWERNVRRVLDDGPEAQSLRDLLGCARLPPGHPLDPEGRSVVIASRVTGRLHRSVVIDCDLDGADLHDAIRVGLSTPGSGVRYGVRTPP